MILVEIGAGKVLRIYRPDQGGNGCMSPDAIVDRSEWT